MKEVIPSDTILANLDRRFLQEAIEKIIESNGYITAKKYGIGSEVSLITLFNTLILKTTRSIILRFLKNQRL